MRKLIWTTMAVLASALIFSFSHNRVEADKITVTVTADKPTTFDMYCNQSTKKGLKTPYELTLSAAEAKFIFRTQSSANPVKISMRNGYGGSLTANWPVTVVLIDRDMMTTFGID